MKVILIGKRNIFIQQSSYNNSIIFSVYLAAEIIAKEGKPLQTLICEEFFVKCS
jgi:hypothetical protein